MTATQRSVGVRRALTLPAGAALLACAGLAWWMAPRAGNGEGERQAPVMLAPEAVPAAMLARYAIPSAASAPLPPSLAGTSADGEFTIDGAGRFVPDENALRLFEYYFSAHGEESGDIIRGRILLHAIGAGVSSAAVADIASTLDRYIAYRDAARAALAPGSRGPADLASRVAALRAIQLAALGPELRRAFYGDDARLAEVDIRRLAILKDLSLGEGERQRALASIDAELPAAIRDARKAASAPSALYHKTEATRAAGGSSEEVAAIRRAAYGAGAAERLAGLDQARARWQARLAAYRGEESALRTAYHPASDSYRQARDALRRRHFAKGELARVRALDAAGL